MGRIPYHRKKIKEANLKFQESKRAAAQATEPQDEHLNTAESADAVTETKSKPGRKKIQKEEINLVKTRQMASILEAKEREKEEIRNRTENSREQIAENRKNSKKRRREIIEKVNQNIKIRKLEEKTKELQEKLAAKPSTTSFDPLSIITEEDQVLAFKSQPTFDVRESTRIKNVLDLTQNKYDVFRKELAKKGITMPSPSTVKRNEKRIFKEYYPNTEKPDFFGMIEKSAMKHDFSTLENVRITIGGDGGGNGKKSSVKIGFFFNDVETPLSVEKFYIIWSYVGKETWQRLKPILEYIDVDVLRLQQDGVMTNSGLKPVIITYIGDCKFLCECLSIQGGNAGCGCPKCVAKRLEWPTIKAADIILRTIESIVENAEQVLNHNGQPKMYSSVFQFPLLRNIPISHFVPPPVHILISLL